MEKTYTNSSTGSGIEWDGTNGTFWMYVGEESDAMLRLDTTDMELAATRVDTGEPYQFTAEDIKAAKAEIDSSHAPERAKRMLGLALDWCACKPETHRRNPADTVMASSHSGIFEFLKLKSTNGRYYVVALDNGIERGYAEYTVSGILDDNRGGILDMEAYDTMLVLFGVDQNDLEEL